MTSTSTDTRSTIDAPRGAGGGEAAQATDGKEAGKEAGKESAPGAKDATRPANDDAKSAAKESRTAVKRAGPRASTGEPLAKPPVRQRSAVEARLYDGFMWLEREQHP